MERRRRKRNQVFCDLTDEEFELFSAWATRLQKTNGQLSKVLIKFFLNAPNDTKKQILQHEINSVFEENSLPPS